MSIQIKVASTATELRDVYRLRYQVYVESEGFFDQAAGDMIVDQFDSMPYVANLIAYHDDTPVGTMRINRDTELLLPADESYDFSDYRAAISKEAKAAGAAPPVVIGAGMLAIATAWRNRRDVFRALFTHACHVTHGWKVTHVITIANATAAGIYRRMGYEAVADKFWSESIGADIIPMCCTDQQFYQWAFAALHNDQELLDNFADCFHYRLFDLGNTIFNEGETGHEAYVINRGVVNVFHRDSESGKALTLATLKAGDIFGELSLIDDLPRSASTRAASNVELIVLSREKFWQKVQQDPKYQLTLLRLLSRRTRSILQHTRLYAHASNDERLRYFLDKIAREAIPSAKHPNRRIAKVGLEEFAFMANTSLSEAKLFLQQPQRNNKISVSARDITFTVDNTK